MNDLQIFENPQFGAVRIITEDGKTLFCGRDVAAALGYKRPKDAVAAHCKGAVKRRTLTSGGKQEMLFISEGDIYRLAAKSELPGADAFESWIFDEVLPSIRRTGCYVLTKAESEQIKQLQQLQADLQEWKRLETRFCQHTSAARKAYVENRTNRNTCRVNISRLEQMIDALIGQLDRMPQIR